MKTLHHCVFDIHAHLVLVTKYRKKVIHPAMVERLQEILAATCQKWGCSLEEFYGEADHVHLLLALTPVVQPSRLVNNLKTVSSRLIRKEFAGRVNRYYRKPVETLRRYIEEQQAGPDS